MGYTGPVYPTVVSTERTKNPESTGCWEHRINFSYVESRGNLQYDYPSLKIDREREGSCYSGVSPDAQGAPASYD